MMSYRRGFTLPDYFPCYFRNRLLISEEQKGFLKGRYIGENIKLLYDTMLYTNKHQVPGLLMMVDFEKGFDNGA